MVARDRIYNVCATIRRYSPITNLVLWFVTASGFIYLHYDLKRHNFELYQKSSEERMALFEERDTMIMSLMQVRTESVARAVDAIKRNADAMSKNVEKMDDVSAKLDLAAEERKRQMELIQQILDRLPQQDET